MKDGISTQPSLCYWAFGYSYYSQMTIQSKFQAAGLQESVLYFILLLRLEALLLGA